MESWMNALPTPCYVVDEGRLISNLTQLKSVAERSGCKVLLAQKAFSMYSLYPLMREFLHGTAASGLFEAKLGAEHFGGETHVYSPAYKAEDMAEITRLCGHVVFNSFAQWERFGRQALDAGCECGLRINPECSTQTHAIYDPCAPGSRLGITAANFQPDRLNGITGLHMHTLCEQNADALETTLRAAEKKFGAYFGRMQWLNLGGGHHVTRADYDVDLLVSELVRVRDKYDVQVYIEPGEAVALNAGWLVTTVLDVVSNGIDIAILDTSAACHMPDVIEMPYRPPLMDAGQPGEKAYTYRLAGPTCLAGDVIGDYSFDAPLKAGDRLAFCDMAIYTMVKNNTFNGMPLPAIAVRGRDGEIRIVKTFGYEDFKQRLS
ncbi:MAG: carboxynorspermidine decarboxylase [Christensenellaceae bacterium]|nr:carboxynorspermidine decarboxylase [Christensenellaceae bacterium]